MISRQRAIRFNGQKFGTEEVGINFEFTDPKEDYYVWIKNGVLHYRKGKLNDQAEATLTLTRSDLNELLFGAKSMPDLIAAGQVKIKGDKAAFGRMMAMMDTFDPVFPIVTP